MTASSKSSFTALSRSDILYEDEWLIAVNKSQGVYWETVFESVTNLIDYPAESNGSSEVSGSRLKSLELHVAKRLDRDTSGVMLITKLHSVAAKLVKAFTDHKVTKTYLALCIGPAPKWQKITIKSGHGQSKFGAFHVYAASDVGRKLPGGSVVKEMETSFEVLGLSGEACFKVVSEFKHGDNIVVAEGKAEKIANAEKDDILVRAFPRSGRTH